MPSYTSKKASSRASNSSVKIWLLTSVRRKNSRDVFN